jgi:hypothetical protein
MATKQLPQSDTFHRPASIWRPSMTPTDKMEIAGFAVLMIIALPALMLGTNLLF